MAERVDSAREGDKMPIPVTTIKMLFRAGRAANAVYGKVQEQVLLEIERQAITPIPIETMLGDDEEHLWFLEDRLSSEGHTWSLQSRDWASSRLTEAKEGSSRVRAAWAAKLHTEAEAVKQEGVEIYNQWWRHLGPRSRELLQEAFLHEQVRTPEGAEAAPSFSPPRSLSDATTPPEVVERQRRFLEEERIWWKARREWLNCKYLKGKKEFKNWKRSLTNDEIDQLARAEAKRGRVDGDKGFIAPGYR